MEHSLYPDGVVVRQQNLVADSSAKTSAIIRRHVDTSNMGVVSGFRVSVASTNTKVRVDAGTAYVANGEMVQLLAGLDNLALADAALNARNVVVAFYREVMANSQTHEDLGITLPTLAKPDCLVKVMTETAYKALPATDQNYNNDALDRAVVLAVVIGQGGVLTNADNVIVKPTTFTAVYGIERSFSMTGVDFVGLDSTINTGVASLKYIPAASGQPAYLAWQSQGEAQYGTAIAVPTDGRYPLPGYSLGQVATVSVTVTSLPGGSVPLYESVTVTNLYGQEVPRYSARDEQHRHMIGSGTPTTRNPHGLTIDDVVGGSMEAVFQKHQDVMHANGIVKTSLWGPTRSVLASSIRRTTGQHDAVIVSPFTAGDELYINGLQVTALADVTGVVSFADVISTGFVSLYGIYIKADGTLTHSTPRVTMSPSGGTATDGMTNRVQVVNVSDTWSIATPLWIAYDFASDSFAVMDTATVSAQQFSPIWTTRLATNGIIRLYAPDGFNWIDVWVQSTGTTWTADVTTTFQVTALPDTNTFYRIAYVVMHSGATAVLGYSTLNNPSGTTDNLIDTRTFGTTDSRNLRDDTIADLVVTPARELRSSGVVSGFKLGKLTSSVLSIDGGVLYYNGVRYTVAAQTASIGSSGNFYIYATVNPSNVVVLNVGSTYADTAVGIPLWYVKTVGGVITVSNSLMRSISALDKRAQVVVDPSGTSGMFTSVTAAIQAMGPCEIVCLPGTYREPTTVVADGSAIIGSPSVIFQLPLDGATTTFVFNAPGRIENVSIVNTNGITSLASWIGINVNSAYVDVNGCDLQGGTPTGAGTTYGVMINTTSHTPVRNCTFTALKAGIATGVAADITSTNNTFNTNHAASITCSGIEAFAGVKRLLVDACKFSWLNTSSTSLRYGIFIYGGVSESAKITNNSVSDTFGTPGTTPNTYFVSILGNAGNVENIEISNNTVLETRQLANITTDATHCITVATISDNIYRRSPQGTHDSSWTIKVESLGAGTTNWGTNTGVGQVTICDNQLVNPGEEAIWVRELAGTAVINGNTIQAYDGKCRQGVVIFNSLLVANNVPHATVVNNTISFIGWWRAASVGCSAIEVMNYGGNGGIPCVICDNTVNGVGSATYSTSACGISVGSVNTLHDYVISNNQINTIQAAGGGFTPAIFLNTQSAGSDWARFVINGNTVTGAQYGISTNAALSNYSIIGNVFNCSISNGNGIAIPDYAQYTGNKLILSTPTTTADSSNTVVTKSLADQYYIDSLIMYKPGVDAFITIPLTITGNTYSTGGTISIPRFVLPRGANGSKVVTNVKFGIGGHAIEYWVKCTIDGTMYTAANPGNITTTYYSEAQNYGGPWVSSAIWAANKGLTTLNVGTDPNTQVLSLESIGGAGTATYEGLRSWLVPLDLTVPHSISLEGYKFYDIPHDQHSWTMWAELQILLTSSNLDYASPYNSAAWNTTSLLMV